jgi:hypothetical protein
MHFLNQKAEALYSIAQNNNYDSMTDGPIKITLIVVKDCTMKVVTIREDVDVAIMPGAYLLLESSNYVTCLTYETAEEDFRFDFERKSRTFSP